MAGPRNLNIELLEMMRFKISQFFHSQLMSPASFRSGDHQFKIENVLKTKLYSQLGNKIYSVVKQDLNVKTK